MDGPTHTARQREHQRRDRLVSQVHDLAVSKLVAGRKKDLDFVSVLLREHMAEPTVLRERVDKLPLAPERLDALKTCLLRLERKGHD